MSNQKKSNLITHPIPESPFTLTLAGSLAAAAAGVGSMGAAATNTGGALAFSSGKQGKPISTDKADNRRCPVMTEMSLE